LERSFFKKNNKTQINISQAGCQNGKFHPLVAINIFTA